MMINLRITVCQRVIKEGMNMLMPKAKRFNAQQTEDAKQRFSIRKYSFGTTSVLLGFSFMIWGAGGVSADTTTTSAETSTELVSKSDPEPVSADAVSKNTLADPSAQAATETTATKSQSAAQTTAVHSSENESSDTEAAGTTGLSSNAAESDGVAAEAIDSNKQAVNSDKTSENTVDETGNKTQTNADGQTSEQNSTAAGETTENNQTEASDKHLQPSLKTVARAAAVESSNRLVQGKSLTLSSKEIGYLATGNTRTKSSITATVSFSGEVGDKFTLQVPANVNGQDKSVLYDLGAYSKSSIAQTTVTEDNGKGYFYITSLFKEAGNITQTFTFTSIDSQVATLGKTMVDSASIGSREMEMILSAEDASGNSLGTVNATFNQVMNPTISPVLERQPEQKYQNSFLPNTDVTYMLNLKELPGINNATGEVVNYNGRVIKSINYGTEIRIPVPEQFELNAAETALKNEFGDQTTITQAGKGAEIFITVPKGSGNYLGTLEEQELPYYIVGKYVFDGTVNQTVTAANPITITQYFDDAHSKKITSKDNIVWTENINSDDSSDIVKGTVRTIGYGAWIGEELVLKDTANKLSVFTFENQSSYDLPDATFTFQVANGFNATSITTPKVAGTNSYTYTLVYADKTTSTGTVAAGETIQAVGSSPIRRAILTADIWKAGVTTETTVESNTFAMTKSPVQRFYINGNLADSYDNRDPVKVGDSLTNILTVTSKYLKKGSFGDTQKVVSQYLSNFNIIQTQSSNRIPGASQVLTIYNGASPSDVLNDYLEKPIIYVVLPQYAIYNKEASSYYGNPTVSTYYVNNGANQVVKLDYSQTDYQYNIRNDNYKIVADISNDALPGTYTSHYFIKTTSRIRYAYDATTSSKYNPDLYKPEYTEGDTENIQTKGVYNAFTLNITPSGESFSMGAMSQGNLDTSYQNTGKSDTTGSTNMSFEITPTNLTQGNLTNLRIYSNLPAEGKVYLTGPVTTSTTDAKMWYSTRLVDLTNDNEETNNDWLSADQVTDWSTIKSVKLQMDSLAKATAANRVSFIMPITDASLKDDAGKTLTLGYKTYADKFATPIKKSVATSIFISGPGTESRKVTRTINVHLPSGKVETTKQEAEIKRNYNVDSTGKTTFEEWNTSSWAEFANIPDISGYLPSQKIVSEEKVDSNTTDVTVDIYYTMLQKAQVNYVDRDDKDNVIGSSGVLFGQSNTAIGYSTADTIQKLKAAGYVVDSSDYPDNPTYDTDAKVDQVYTVVLKHGHEKTDRSQKVTRRVVYEVPAGFEAPESVDETLSFAQTGVQDLVTKNISWDSVDSRKLKAVLSPQIAGLTPDKEVVAAEEVTPTFDGDTSTTVTVVYTAKPQKARVNYVDSDGKDAVIATSGELTGVSKGVISYSTADTIKKLSEAGYVFVLSDYPSEAVYDTDDAVDQVYTVVLKHQTRENVNSKDAKQTTHFVGADQKLPDKVKTEHGAFKQVVVVDLVTGKVVKTGPWTGQKTFATEKVPVVDGYHADKSSVGEMTATPDHPEVEATVVYMQNGRMILVDENGRELPGTTSRRYQTDPTDPSKVLAVVVPTVRGYQPRTHKAGEKLMPSDPAIDTYIVYYAPAKPKVPSKHKNSKRINTPSDPTRPGVPSMQNNPNAAWITDKVDSSNAVGSRSANPNSNKISSAAELPQTGSDDKQSSEMTLMGAILLALSAATGFVTGKKRKKD